ncbi:hypothetical protein [Desulfofustis limnaeus]|uniref:Uncharacterized protein n=1 Tax=Desulfofustis limnaeus TaxID=2740163 RepID=A0ABN6LZ59_9BACT|nr:hypothetical protein [Desulfofustis limnaeus]BDD85924.1 hypothetical protein DPPLL_02890 [Desulfofustis limnaeus]
MITLDDITLPDDLWWQDETDWTPVQQEEGFSITGALLLDVSTKQAGRPITLVGDEGWAWTTRAVVLALQAKAAQPGLEMSLSLHDRTFTVLFRHADGRPIEAESLTKMTPPADTDIYLLHALRLLMKEETTQG